MISKIDAALRKIEDGSYGYCEETGEPISLKRLDARPIATLSVEAQEQLERQERIERHESREGSNKSLKGSFDPTMTEEQKESLERVKDIPANNFFELAKWARETNNLQGFERSMPLTPVDN